MTIGEIAGLLAAIAALIFVAVCAVPLLKLGRVLEEVRLAVRDIGHSTVPILTELKGTVTATNDEITKLAVVTQDVATVASHATVVSENVAQMSNLFSSTLGKPMIKFAAATHGLRQAFAGTGKLKRKAR